MAENIYICSVDAPSEFKPGFGSMAKNAYSRLTGTPRVFKHSREPMVARTVISEKIYGKLTSKLKNGCIPLRLETILNHDEYGYLSENEQKRYMVMGGESGLGGELRFRLLTPEELYLSKLRSSGLILSREDYDEHRYRDRRDDYEPVYTGIGRELHIAYYISKGVSPQAMPSLEDAVIGMFKEDPAAVEPFLSNGRGIIPVQYLSEIVEAVAAAAARRPRRRVAAAAAAAADPDPNAVAAEAAAEAADPDPNAVGSEGGGKYTRRRKRSRRRKGSRRRKV